MNNNLSTPIKLQSSLATDTSNEFVYNICDSQGKLCSQHVIINKLVTPMTRQRVTECILSSFVYHFPLFFFGGIIYLAYLCSRKHLLVQVLR